MFARLREILAEPHTADGERWQALTKLIDAWEDDDEREQAIAYVEAHLAIPDIQRDMYTLNPRARHWPLVRKLYIDDSSPRKLYEAPSLGHIKMATFTQGIDITQLPALNQMTALEQASLRVRKLTKALDALEILPNLHTLRIKVFDSGDKARSSGPKETQKRCLAKLRSLDLEGNYSLKHIAHLEQLESLRLGPGGHSVNDLRLLEQFPQLQALTLDDIDEQTNLESLTALRLPQLESLTLEKWYGLESLNNTENLAHIKHLTILNSHCLASLAGIESMPQLESLTLRHCVNLYDISAISNLPNLRSLEIHAATGLAEVSPISQLSSLTTLKLWRCSGIDKIKFLSPLQQLQTLYLTATNISSLSPLSKLTALEQLSLYDCRKLKHLNALKNVEQLMVLKLDACDALTSIDALASLQELHTLWLKSCKKLRDLKALEELGELRTLSMHYSTLIRDLTPLCALPYLSDLDLSGCANLPKPRRKRYLGIEEINAWREETLAEAKEE